MAQKIKEKRFFILEVDKKNKNHRIFTDALVKTWLNSDKLKENGEGLDIECAIEDDEYDYEYLKDEFNIGRVVRLEMEGKKLFGVSQFKVEGDSPYVDKINNEEGFLDKCALVPKGKGAVKNQIVQDDYELYGFNLIWAHESSFAEDVPVTEAAAKA